jgi:mono/diheme cytochrome c family protein
MIRPFAALATVLVSLSAHSEDGERMYNRVCAACHLAEGLGAPQIAPPLRSHVACLAARQGGRTYVAGVLEYGLEGPIAVDGVEYDGYMPPIAQLSPVERAAVLNYLLSLGGSCTKGVRPFTAADMEAPVDGTDWNAQRMRLLRKEIAPAPGGSGGYTPAESRDNSRAATDFSLHCQGCHTPSGTGVAGAVPALQNAMGRFLQVPEGREFLVRVPGVAFAPLDDQRLAELLNWALSAFSAAQIPADFRPYDAAEVAELRRRPLLDVEVARQQVMSTLAGERLRLGD